MADAETGEVKAIIPQTFHVHAVKYTSELTNNPSVTTSIVNGMSFILVPLPDLPTLAKADRNLHGDSYGPSSLDEGWRNGFIGTMYYVPNGKDTFGEGASAPASSIPWRTPAQVAQVVR